MAVSPTLSREWHYHTIQTPGAGEGADRSKLKNPCSDQIQMMFKKTSGTFPNNEVFENLFVSGPVCPIPAVQRYPEDPRIVKKAFDKDVLSLIHAEFAVAEGILTQEAARNKDVFFASIEKIIRAPQRPPSLDHQRFNLMVVRVFPENLRVIKAAYRWDPKSISTANPEAIVELMKPNGPIISEHAIQAFPENKEVIKKAYADDPKSISKAKSSIIVQLISRNAPILPEHAIQAFPVKHEVINAACAMKEDLIKAVSKDVIKTMLSNPTVVIKMVQIINLISVFLE